MTCSLPKPTRALLSELDAGSAEVHDQIVAAMITGDLAPLEARLDAQYGRSVDGESPDPAGKRYAGRASGGSAWPRHRT
jgi:hypothetical protein